jgi:hypothetical protein
MEKLIVAAIILGISYTIKHIGYFLNLEIGEVLFTILGIIANLFIIYAWFETLESA